MPSGPIRGHEPGVPGPLAPRLGRVLEALDWNRGVVTVETMWTLSTDHPTGHGLNSVCRHAGSDYTDPASLSAAVFDIDDDDPERSAAYVASGTSCHAWHSAEGEGSIRLSPTASETGVPDWFLTTDAWIAYYAESPSESSAGSDPPGSADGGSGS